MYERIIEIIVYVIAELRSNKSINDINITELKNLGYSNEEISTALSWIIDKMDSADKLLSQKSLTQSHSFRILSDEELSMFTKEAWGDLIQYNALGIMSNTQIELLIDRASMMGIREVDSNHIKMFVAHAIFNLNLSDSSGNRFMLLGNDTIN